MRSRIVRPTLVHRRNAAPCHLTFDFRMTVVAREARSIRPHRLALVAILLALGVMSAATTAVATAPSIDVHTMRADGAHTQRVIRSSLSDSAPDRGSAPASTTRTSSAARLVFKVRSNIAAKNVLGHRLHWVAYPNLPASQIRAVDFLIDGKLRWVEHHAPYSYGYDGNYLVTTWLAPGIHTFRVLAVATDGRKTSTVTTRARVSPSAPPPSALAGRWTSFHPAGGAPAGNWSLIVDKVGWRVIDPSGGGNLIDAAYLTGGQWDLRTGIWTKPHGTSPSEGNGWCEETNKPVRFAWSSNNDTLTLAHQGIDGSGESDILDGKWTRVA